MKKFIFNLQLFVEEYYNDSPNKTLNGTNNADYFENNGSIVKIFAKGGDDTIKNTGNTVTISSGAGDDSVRNEGGSNVTITGDTGNDEIFSHNSSSTENISIFGGTGDDSIHNSYGEKITLQGGDGNDKIINSSSSDNVKIFGGAGKDTVNVLWTYRASINGGADSDYISIYQSNYIFASGGAGNDTIVSDAYRDAIGNTISGGAGNDKIELQHSYYTKDLIAYTYGDGDDTIFGFDSDDTLRITTSKKFSTLSSGGDLYITFDKGSIVLKDVNMGVGGIGKKNIVTVSGGGSSTDTLPSGLTLKGTTITASKNFKGKAIDLNKYEKVKTLDAAEVTQALKITGNKLSNKIFGGKSKDTIYGGAGNDSILGNAGNDKLFGDAGNDTLFGGIGNDTLTGGNGNDVFVHSKGKDVITDYSSGDKIFLQDTAIKSWKVSGKNVIFTTESGTVTVKDGKGKRIAIESSKIYSSSSAKTSSILFTEENNFVSSDNLSSIVKNNLTPSALEKITTTNFENLAQENIFVTYNEK